MPQWQLTPTQHPPSPARLTAGPADAAHWCPDPVAGCSELLGAASLLVTVPPPPRPAALSVLPPCCSRAAFPASPAPCALGYPLPCPALHRLQPRLRAGCPQEPLQCLLNTLEIRSPAITVLGSPGEPFALDTLPAWQQPAAVSPALRCGSSHEHFTSAFPGRKGHAANASGSMEANIARKA